MSPARLRSLRERLLRGGVAPRHVRRYVRELRDHYEDILAAERGKGLARAEAERAASKRLGTEDQLVQSMLGRPELRSTAARFPALVFGLGPALAWLAAVVSTFCILRLLPISSSPQPPGGLLAAAHALGIGYLRVLPGLLGVLVLLAASHRRMQLHWPLAGAALVDLLAGSLTIHLIEAGVGVTSSLLPWIVPFSSVFGPRDMAAFGEGLLRAGGMLAASAVAHRAWLAARAARAA